MSKHRLGKRLEQLRNNLYDILVENEEELSADYIFGCIDLALEAALSEGWNRGFESGQESAEELREAAEQDKLDKLSAE